MAVAVADMVQLCSVLLSVQWPRSVKSADREPWLKELDAREEFVSGEGDLDYGILDIGVLGSGRGSWAAFGGQVVDVELTLNEGPERDHEQIREQYQHLISALTPQLGTPASVKESHHRWLTGSTSFTISCLSTDMTTLSVSRSLVGRHSKATD
jgi:hypothetical protein